MAAELSDGGAGVPKQIKGVEGPNGGSLVDKQAGGIPDIIGRDTHRIDVGGTGFVFDTGVQESDRGGGGGVPTIDFGFQHPNKVQSPGLQMSASEVPDSGGDTPLDSPKDGMDSTITAPSDIPSEHRPALRPEDAGGELERRLLGKLTEGLAREREVLEERVAPGRRVLAELDAEMLAEPPESDVQKLDMPWGVVAWDPVYRANETELLRVNEELERAQALAHAFEPGASEPEEPEPAAKPAMFTTPSAIEAVDLEEGVYMVLDAKGQQVEHRVEDPLGRAALNIMLSSPDEHVRVRTLRQALGEVPERQISTMISAITDVAGRPLFNSNHTGDGLQSYKFHSGRELKAEVQERLARNTPHEPKEV